MTCHGHLPPAPPHTSLLYAHHPSPVKSLPSSGLITQCLHCILFAFAVIFDLCSMPAFPTTHLPYFLACFCHFLLPALPTSPSNELDQLTGMGVFTGTLPSSPFGCQSQRVRCVLRLMCVWTCALFALLCMQPVI